MNKATQTGPGLFGSPPSSQRGLPQHLHHGQRLSPPACTLCLSAAKHASQHDVGVIPSSQSSFLQCRDIAPYLPDLCPGHAGWLMALQLRNAPRISSCCFCTLPRNSSLLYQGV